MSFVPKKHTYNAHINEVVLGVGDKAVTIGGQNVLAFHTFDGEITNAPKIGVELTDAGMAMCTMPGEQKFYEGCATVADMAKRAAAIVKAVANFTDAKLIAELSEDLGEAMVGINADEIELIMEERGR